MKEIESQKSSTIYSGDSNIQKKYSELNIALNKLRVKETEYENKIQTNDHEIKSLKKQIEQLNTKIKDIQNENNELQNKYFYIIINMQ